MNEADINQRLNELTKMETGLTNEIGNIQKALTQKQADLFAVQGAKQDCGFWLAKVNTPVQSGSNTPPPAIPPAVLNTVKSVEKVDIATTAKPDQPKPGAVVKKAITNK